MDIPVSKLYKLLRRFKFSIGGYSNPEKEVSDFFYKLCKNQLINQNESIRLLMFGFAQLKANAIDEIDLEKWETEPLSRFNYFDYYSGYAEVLLSLYVYCLNIISDKRATNIISDNFRRNINLRVFIDKKACSIRFRENNRLDALEIVIPGNFFQENAFQIDINSFCADGISIENFVIQDNLYEHEYKFDEKVKEKYNKVYEKLTAKIFKVLPNVFLKNINDYLPSEEVQKKIKERTLKNPNANLTEILAVAYSASLFCYYFDCSFEYFVSVSNVSLDKVYSLGSLAVGIKNGADLSFDERALLSIISNHIASNLSAQIIFENNKEIKRNALRSKILIKYKAFKELAVSKQLHGTEIISDDQLNEIKVFVNSNEFFFSSLFNSNLDLLKNKNKNYISKYCLIELKENEYCDCKIEKPLHLFSKECVDVPKCHNPIGNMEFINIPFINGLFEKFTENRNGSTCTIISKSIQKKKIIFEVEYVPGFPLNNFYSKLKDSHLGDLIGTYFIENYSLLDAHGVFKIIDNEDREIFNSRDMINMVIGKKLILKENRFKTDATNLRKLKLIFINELI